MSDRYRSTLEEVDATAGPKSWNTRRSLTADQQRILIGVSKRLYDESTRDDGSGTAEKRDQGRKPFARPVLMTPCADRIHPDLENTEPVIGKDVSPTGMSVIAYRCLRVPFVLVTVPSSDLIPTCILSEVRYETPVKQGLYSIGVSFIERVHLSLEELIDAADFPAHQRTA